MFSIYFFQLLLLKIRRKLLKKLQISTFIKKKRYCLFISSSDVLLLRILLLQK